MTNQDEPIDVSVDARFLVIDAFLDGERVDPEALKDALREPGCRDHLVDLLVLREAVGAAVPVGINSIPAHHRGRSRLAWIATAAAIVVSVTAAYLAGQHTADGPQRTTEAIVEIGGPQPAPAPTRIIPLKPGVNWTDSQGGR